MRIEGAGCRSVPAHDRPSFVVPIPVLTWPNLRRSFARVRAALLIQAVHFIKEPGPVA